MRFNQQNMIRLCTALVLLSVSVASYDGVFTSGASPSYMRAQTTAVAATITPTNQQQCTFSRLATDGHCWDETCASPILNSQQNTGKACQCTEDDIGSKYSECDSTQQRTLYYFWKPPATCINGTLPNPIPGIPCALVCGNGTYLDTASKTCQKCQPGTASSGGGRLWNEWNYFPAQFTTSCAIYKATTKKCQSWRLNGDSVDSGNNQGIDSMQSILKMDVHMVRPGYVYFEYKVNAERNYDGLWFTVNDAQIFFSSYSNGWTTFNYSLPAGYHSVEWVYYKDLSVTAGDDKLTIKTIKVEGTTYALTACDKCPYGYYSNQLGAGQCTACPAGTFSKNDTGAVTCDPCPGGYYSYAGSSSCIPSRPCSVEDGSLDYSSYVTSCVNHVHTKKYVWIQPMQCDSSNGVQLPADVQESCDPESCPAGQHSNSNNDCVYCDSGSASSGHGNPCVVCDVGFASSPKIRYYKSWVSPWPAEFSSKCEGEGCFSPSGWRFGYSFTDSGTSNSNGANSWLQLSVDAINGASVSFNYSLACSGYDNQLFLTVDNVLVESFHCPSVQPGNQCSSTPYALYQFTLSDPDSTITSKTFDIKFSYSVSAPSIPTNATCDRAIITSITVNGVTHEAGGSEKCVPCEAGTYSPDPQQS